MISECNVETTLQVLDPFGTDVETGGRTGEEGITLLTVGQQFVDVVFTDTHDNYTFDVLVIENFVDNPPMCIMVGPIVYSDSTGFRLMVNAAPDSGFYQLHWRISG